VRDPGERAEGGRDLLRGRPRRLAQPARELEGHRHREVAHLPSGGVVDDERRQRRGIEVVEAAQDGGHVLAQGVANGEDHGSLSYDGVSF
jgi:hypothetical protein